MAYFLHRYGYWPVFLAVLAENLGLPVPSYLLVLVSASLAAQLQFRLTSVVLVSAVAALLGDLVWYCLGRWRGRRILRTLCSISINPDSCVSRTENLFTRHGLKSLFVAKFIPGLNTVAPPLAGMLKVSAARFVLFDLGGTALWVFSAVLLGVVGRSQVERLLELLTAFGKVSLLVLAIVFSAWLVIKWLGRRRFYRLLERSRISASELRERLDRNEDVVIVDLRSDLDYGADQVKLPGAIRMAPKEFEGRYKEIPTGRPVVMYCS